MPLSPDILLAHDASLKGDQEHCHNLNHAVAGLIVHLMHQGVTTPYVIGRASGNQPE
jgi:hypothetical protein